MFGLHIPVGTIPGRPTAIQWLQDVSRTPKRRKERKPAKPAGERSPDSSGRVDEAPAPLGERSPDGRRRPAANERRSPQKPAGERSPD